MSLAADHPDGGAAGLVWRGAGFLTLWCVLIGLSPGDLAMGLPASAAATAASLRLAPGRSGISARGVLRYGLRFLPQSLLAATEVARHAFAPRPALQPGFVTCGTRVPPGLRRGWLCALTSLQPGRLPVAETADGIELHCLDLGQGPRRQAEADETAFAAMFRPEAPHG